MDKEFSGSISKIKPSRIIDVTKQEDEFEDFFLVLGLVYNDLKGLLTFSTFLSSTYKKPDSTLSFHTGNYNGLDLQLYKLIVSLVNEFFLFLEENKNIVTNPKFMLLIKDIKNPYHKKLWEDIKMVALNQTLGNKSSDFAKTLAKIRNNISYHYKQSAQPLRMGFTNFFFNSGKQLFNEYALYALGKNMTETRFFYIDASIQNFISKSFKTPADIGKLKETVGAMNEFIATLMKQYLSRS